MSAVLALFFGLLMFASPAHAAPTEVTPSVTFPDPCTVVVADIPGVIYTVTLDGDTSEIDPDTYDGFEFAGDTPAVFKAEAAEGFVMAPDVTTTEWTYTPGDECFDDIGGDSLVDAEASCSAVTFTNLTDEPVEVFYGGVDEEDFADGDVTIPAGGTRKISTSRDELLFAALAGDPEDPDGIQIDFIEVPQDCGVDAGDPDPSVKWPIKHPTRAPAAGVVSDDGGPSLPAMALLGALALIAVRRSYTLGR